MKVLRGESWVPLWNDRTSLLPQEGPSLLSAPVGRIGGNILTEQGGLDRPGSKPALSLNLKQVAPQQSNDKNRSACFEKLFPEAKVKTGLRTLAKVL